MKNGWTSKRLGDVARTQYGLSESMNEDGKGYKIFRMGEVQQGRLIDTGRMKYVDISRQDFEQYKLRKGDVLFNRTNSFELVGKTGIFELEGDYCFASYLVRLNLDETKVLSRFLNYFMNSDSFQRSVKKKASKSINQANINATILSNESICFPESITDQQRIVGILDEAFEGLATAKANAEKNLQNSRAIFESHLQSVFTKRGDGWVEKQLGDLSRINYGYTESASVEKVGPRFLRITDIQDNRVDWSSVPYCPIEASDYPRYKLAEGDIVFARTGATTGKSYLVTNPPEAVFASYLIRVQLSTTDLQPQFVNLFFQTRSYWDSIRSGVSGSAQGGFNATKLGELLIPFPRSAKEQQSIVTELNALAEETKRLESIYQQKLNALEALKKSLLDQAFTGQL